MKRISSLFQKLCRLDFLVVWPSQVTSPLGALWLLQAGGLCLVSCRAFCPHLVVPSGVTWWGRMSQGSAFIAGLNPFGSPASAVKLLFLQVILSLISCVPSWLRAVGPKPWTCQWRPCPGGPECCCTVQHFILTPSQTTPEGIQICLTRVVNRGST